MTKKNNNMAIGSFIAGAFILLFFLLIFFSGGNYFTDKERVVMYFDGSVQGLQKGAPVKLKGVELGQITNIEVTFLADNLTIVNTVTADLILKRIHHINRRSEQSTDDIYNAVINKGLRAQLNYQSLLTGQLYVELDFYPESELRLRKLQTQYREFPTIKTDFESLFSEIESIDIIAVSNSLVSVLSSLDKLLKSEKIDNAVNDFSVAAQAVEKTANHIGSVATKFSAETATLNTKLSISLDAFNGLVDQINHQVPLLNTEFITTLTDLRETFTHINEAMKTAEGTFSEDSQLIEQLKGSAEEVDRAAQAFRRLSDTLEQQPEALLRGKRGN